MRTRSLLAGLCLSALSAASAQAGDKITLQLRPDKGAEYAQTMKMDSETRMQMGDKPMVIASHTETENTCKVEAVDADGTVTMKTTTEAMRVKTGGPMPMEFDSRKPEAASGPMAKVMSAQVGKTITTKVGRDGKAKEVVVEGGQARGGAKQSPAGLSAFPDHPVGVGDAWDAKMDMGGMSKMPMEMNVHYILVERKHGTAKIKMEGTLVGRMEGTLSGTIDMDEKTGMPSSQEMEMKMKMGGDGKHPAPETTMKSTTTCKKK